MAMPNIIENDSGKKKNCSSSTPSRKAKGDPYPSALSMPPFSITNSTLLTVCIKKGHHAILTSANERANEYGLPAQRYTYENHHANRTPPKNSARDRLGVPKRDTTRNKLGMEIKIALMRNDVL